MKRPVLYMLLWRGQCCPSFLVFCIVNFVLFVYDLWFVPNVACEFSTGFLLFICPVICLHFHSSMLWCSLWYRLKAMFGPSLPLVACMMALLLYMLFVSEVSCITWLYQYNVSKFKATFLKHIISPMNTLNILLWSNHLAYAVTYLLNISTKLTKELNPRFLVGFVLINQSLFVQCFIDQYFCLFDLVCWPCILSSFSNYVFWLSPMASSNFF